MSKHTNFAVILKNKPKKPNKTSKQRQGTKSSYDTREKITESDYSQGCINVLNS